MTPQHRILLLNFTEREAESLAKAGYNVERGFMGKLEKPNKYLPFQIPHPIYEYDILFYNSHVTATAAKDFTSPKNFLNDTGSFEALYAFKGPPHVRVSLIGEPSGMETLLLGGVVFVELFPAHENVSIYERGPELSFSIPELGNLIASFASQIVSVGEFSKIKQNFDIYPFNDNRVLQTRSGYVIARYGTTFERTTIPRYVVLPRVKAPADAALKLLELFEKLRPELFPDKVRQDWLSSAEFLVPEERLIDAEIEAKIQEASAYIDEKRKERQAAVKNYGFVRQLLTATETATVDVGDRLSSLVKRALEFLDFKVVDIDEKIKSAIKKEDFWVMDADFLAIAEVSGTVHKNPKVKEFNDIFGRMASIYKRKGELVLPAASTVSGLLVLNYDVATHPSKRPKMYTGEDEHIAETAVEHGIGLLSTAELHKIVMATMEGLLTKVEARAVLRKPGRIEFDPSVYRRSQPATVKT